MIKFFRKIRHKLLAKSMFRKYLLYAIGEILLVVIGILIALSVNNWNTKKQLQKEIDAYYSRIQQEVVLTIEYIESLNNKLTRNYHINKRSLHILDLKNRDSLPLLENTIGTLGVNYTTNLSTPIIEEFLGKGFLSKVDNDSIKVYMQAFKIIAKRLNRYDVYVDTQYVNAIEPFFYKHINYAQVTGDRRQYLISGGPETNFNQFFNDLELWNLLNFKIESIEEHQNRLSQFSVLLNRLNQSLKQQIAS